MNKEVEIKDFKRNTQQRQVILEELRKVKSHPTAAQLYDSVRKRLPKVSLGTVYRNLDILANSGTICKLNHSGAEARFDATTAKHYHLRCLECEAIEDVFNVPIYSLEATTEDLHGYDVVDHNLEFLGICPRCQNKQIN